MSKTIASASATAIFYAVLYFLFITTQLPGGWTLHKIYIAAIAGSLIAGLLAWIWTRGFVASFIGTVAGVMIGGTYVEYRFSDTNIGIPAAAWVYVTQFQFVDFLIIVAGVIAWLATDRVMRHVKCPPKLYRNRVAVLFTGAILAGLAFNLLMPITEFLTFTRYDIQLLRHWELLLGFALLLISLVFGILAGIFFKGPILAKSLFWALTIGVIAIPNGYSGQLAAKLRHNGLVAMTERLNPLIGAIDAFQKREGKLPSSLDQLVPAYLSKLPETNSGTYNSLDYQPDSDSLKPSYYLRVWTPTGVLNFDEFRYSSNGEYPDYSEGSQTHKYWEHIGNWMYYHE